MDAISIRCKACKHMMKFSVDKAGKKAKCPKCGTVAVIKKVEVKVPNQAEEAEDAAALLLAEEDPAPPPPKVKKKPKLAPVAQQEEEAETLQLAGEHAPQTKQEAEVEALQLAEDAATQAQAQEEEDIIQLAEEPAPKAKTPEPPPPPKAPEPPAKKDEFEDDGPAQYGVYVDPELEERQRILREEEANKTKKKKDRKKLPTVARKIKAIENAADWAKVRLGLLFFVVGAVVWLFTHLLQGSYVLIGSVELPEYANLMNEILQMRADEAFPKEGNAWDIDELDIYVGMIAGQNFLTYGKMCLTVAAVFYLFQAGAWLVGYIFCLPVPRRFGMLSQVLIMLGLGVVNGLVMLAFKLLPLLGAYNYIMIPFVTPEICLTEYNMERLVPVNLLWSGAPFWENFLNVLFKFALYLEPSIACVFVWSIGCAIKDEGLQRSGRNMTELGLGTLFMIFTFHMLSVCGASPVMVMVLRVVYALGYFFLLLFIVQYITLLLRCRAALYEKIHPTNEAKDEKVEDEEEEE